MRIVSPSAAEREKSCGSNCEAECMSAHSRLEQSGNWRRKHGCRGTYHSVGVAKIEKRLEVSFRERVKHALVKAAEGLRA